MYDHITREKLKEKMDRGDNFVLLDTLPSEAFNKGHLPGAISIPSDDIIEEAPKQITEKEIEIIVYCGSGTCKRSEKAAERLVNLGYKKVFEYYEGKANWVDAGLPLETNQ